jgi:hypothetical protein
METDLTPTESELHVKLERIQKLFVQFNLDALLLRQIGNFSWLTCGADSYVNAAAGVKSEDDFRRQTNE